MITDEQMAAYFRDGFAILEKAISPRALPAEPFRRSLEKTVAALGPVRSVESGRPERAG